MSTSSVSRKYDFIIFGASGFTGSYVVEELGRVAQQEAHKSTPITWAVAGRNEDKLLTTLHAAAVNTSIADIQKVDIILCDIDDFDSLSSMASLTSIVLNCVGPYRFYGELVVQACVECGTHHLDVSGEPQYLESIHVKYDAKARQHGVYVIGACGFDSVVAEMGVLYTRQQFAEAQAAKTGKEEGELNAIESFINFIPGPEGYTVHYGTYQSAIYGYAHRGELSTIRKQLYASMPQSPSIQYKHAPLRIAKYDTILGSYCLPFLGSDKALVYRSQRMLYQMISQRPVQFLPYFQVQSMFQVFLTFLCGGLFALLASCSYGCKLLEKFPRLFTAGLVTHEGPSRSQIEGAGFLMTFRGYGWSTTEAKHAHAPDCTITTSLRGPDPGYIGTGKIFVSSGMTLLREQHKMPFSGGVFPPGAAFANTKLVQRLQDCGFVFKTLDQHIH